MSLVSLKSLYHMTVMTINSFNNVREMSIAYQNQYDIILVLIKPLFCSHSLNRESILILNTLLPTACWDGSQLPVTKSRTGEKDV